MKRTWLGIGILFLAAAFTGGCGFYSSSEDPELMQLRTYTVPEGQNAAEFGNYLSNSLGTGDQSLGTVTKYPDGSLVVTAPVSVHEGIEELIEQLAKRGPGSPEPAPASVSIQYWILLGRPGADGVNIASPALKHNEQLRPVLDEIVKAQGGMEFHLLEKLQVQSLDNRSVGEIMGRIVSIHQKVTNHESGQKLADIRIYLDGDHGVTQHKLESRVKLEAGRFIVLGQTAFNPRGYDLSALGGDGDDLMLYYVISSAID